MLTVNDFKDDLPEKILTQSDYFKLVSFLKSWVVKAENPDKLFEFVKSLDKKEIKNIHLKLICVFETFLRFEIKKTSFISDILNDNKDKLSDFTKAKLVEYGTIESGRANDICQILDSIVKVFECDEGK